MKQRQESFTVTLHWRQAGADQAANVVCEDVPPAQLIPLLLRGCGLAHDDTTGTARPFTLRLDTAAGRALHPDQAVGRQGLRSGGHLWLVERDATAECRCVIGLPGGGELLVPADGLELQRAWLLQALALLDPELHRQELARIERRASPYRAVSGRTHCAIVPAAGGFAARTERTDVVTTLNGAPLQPGVASQLRDGDLLTLGEGGLRLAIALMERPRSTP
jgi:hypothetical protein